VWQSLHEQVSPHGVNIVSVCLDTAGTEAAMPHVNAARAVAQGEPHPMLFDPGHLVDEVFGMINVPNAVWIDGSGKLVRPSEPAWPAAAPERPVPSAPPPDGRIGAMMANAGQIVADRAEYAAAVHDWALKGASSQFVLAADEVIGRSLPRGRNESLAAAHFEIAQFLHRNGSESDAVEHFRRSHELQPDNWTYRRQAWSMQPSALDGGLERFWQGPIDGTDWPYRGDWVSDIEQSGPENYYGRFVP
jgi:hypothetical protein